MILIKLWTPKNPEYALTLPLALLCLLFGAVLLVESMMLQRAGSERAQRAGTAGQDASPVQAEPEAVFALPPVDDFSAFVDRPLFLEGRKPVVETEQAQETVQEDKTPLDLSLMGVMLSHQGQIAILAEASGKNRRVKVGGTIAGWRLVELKPDRVTMQRGEERRELPLMKPKPKGPGSAGAPAQPVPPGAARPGRGQQHAAPPPQPEPEPADLSDPDAEETDEPMDPESEAEE